MKFISQHERLPVSNICTSGEGMKMMSHQQRRHGKLFPNSIRCIVCGPSASGKTNLMLTLLCAPNGLRYENVYVYSKSLYQPKYRMLEKIFKKLPEIGYFAYDDSADIVPPQQARPNSIFIFDDVATCKQHVIRDYFSMGRHSSVDCFYLCQTYTHIPKHLVRDNCNLCLLFKQDDMNLRHVYNDHVNTDMDWSVFRSICAACWTNNKYGFLVIDKDSDIKDGRYRRGFDEYILI